MSLNRSKLWRERHPEKVKAQRDKWNAENAHKKRAHRLLRKAVLDGKIVKPQACVQCREQKPLVAHHHDYSKPTDVHWICRKCHAIEHGGVAAGVPKTIVKGEAHGRAKLTQTAVRKIKTQFGLVSMCELARRFGVSESLIRQIRKGDVWKDV